MAYKITDDCSGCGGCEPECPNQAIHGTDTIYVIDPEKCTECVGFYPESRCWMVCGMSAPVQDPARKESREDLLAKFAKLNPGKTPV